MSSFLRTKKEKPLNICFFSHSADLYGAERRLLELITELIEDHEVVCTVILPGKGPLKTKLEAVGALTSIVNYSHWADSDLVSEEERENRLISSFKNILTYTTQQLSKVNPDIIFTQTMAIPWGALAASILGKPHVWNVCEFGILDHGLNFFQPFKFTLDFITQSSNIVLTPSNVVKDTLFASIHKKKVQTLYSYVSVPFDTLSQDKGKYFTRIKATKLIISGTVNEGKGQKDAIMAVKELIKRGHDIELIIMGNRATEYAKHLETIIKDNNLKSYVKFTGFKENPFSVMNQADITLLCSRNEAFGRVTQEAMFLKKPVIATNSGSSPELITEKFNGLLYSSGDYIQLADKIQYFIEHKDKIKEFGENGYRFATKNFTRETFGGRVYKLLRGVKNEVNPLSTLYGGFMIRLISSVFSELQEKNIKINNLEASLQQFNDRTVILVADRYQKVIDKLLRSGTIRRKCYDVMFKGFRVILNEGWRGLWIKKKNT